MFDYIKCPKCELNYIKSGETYCVVCNPTAAAKKIADEERRREAYIEKKRAEYNEYQDSMKAFYAIRYNRKQI